MWGKWCVVGGALGAGLAVVLGAVFAHLPVFAGGVPAAVQSALQMHQMHALGAVAVGLALLQWPQVRAWRWAGALMLLGVVLFCFNIYARHALGWSAGRAWVPWGGAAWMLAWGLLAWGARQACAMALIRTSNRRTPDSAPHSIYDSSQ